MSRRPKTKVPIREGTWFAVPLEGGGWAVGLVSRVVRGLVIIGYFFGPRRRTRPTRASVRRLTRVQAVWVDRLSGLGLELGEWPVLWVDPAFRRAAWPLVDVYLAKAAGPHDLPPAVERQEEALAWLGLAGYEHAAASVKRQLMRGAKRIRLPALGTLPPEPPPRPIQKEKPEQGVLIQFPGSDIAWLDAFEPRMKRALPSRIGIFDGYERGEGDGMLYFYGPDAAALWKRLEPVARKEPALRGATVRVRRGEPGAPERKLVLNGRRLSAASPASR